MSNDIEAWVQRFRALDAQNEDVDEGANYRALVGHASEERVRPTATQAETKARKQAAPTALRTPS
jgi:hypothetical protein